MAPMIDLLIRNARVVTCTDDDAAVTPPAFIGLMGQILASNWVRADRKSVV